MPETCLVGEPTVFRIPARHSAQTREGSRAQGSAAPECDLDCTPLEGSDRIERKASWQ